MRSALNGDKEMTACEMGWLDNGQLRLLIAASKTLARCAESELEGRDPR
jgi:hypothetical protein